MMIINLLIDNKLQEAKEKIYNQLRQIVNEKLQDKRIDIVEAKNPNIIRIGRIQKIRRRVRRNKQGRIVVQRNKTRSAVKGYAISGATVRRIPAVKRIKKARLLRRSWQTTRRAKLRRSLMKRAMSMRRRKSMGLK